MAQPVVASWLGSNSGTQAEKSTGARDGSASRAMDRNGDEDLSFLAPGPVVVLKQRRISKWYVLMRSRNATVILH